MYCESPLKRRRVVRDNIAPAPRILIVPSTPLPPPHFDRRCALQRGQRLIQIRRAFKLQQQHMRFMRRYSGVVKGPILSPILDLRSVFCFNVNCDGCTSRAIDVLNDAM